MFVCRELTDSAVISQFFTTDTNYKKTTSDTDGTRYPIQFRKGVENSGAWDYAQLPYFENYMKSIAKTPELQTISDFATFADITIDDNLDIATSNFMFNVNSIMSIKSPAWFTIINDDSIGFYAPVRLSTSKSINSFKLLTLNTTGDKSNDVNYEGESATYTVHGKFNTVIPEIIDDDFKKLIVKKQKSRMNIATIAVSRNRDVSPMDYFTVDSVVYLVVSKRNLDFETMELIGVKEITEDVTITQADAPMPYDAGNSMRIRGVDPNEYAAIYKTSDTDTLNATDNHKITGYTTIYNDKGIYASDKFTIQETGYYNVSGFIELFDYNASGEASLFIYVNGSQLYKDKTGGINREMIRIDKKMIPLTKNDYVEFYVYLGGTYTGKLRGGSDVSEFYIKRVL